MEQNNSKKMTEIPAMARIQTRKGKNRTTFTATVRVKDFAPIARTFDTKGEAKGWAANIEREIRMGRYQDARPAEKFPFREALERYLKHVSTAKRINLERRDRVSVTASASLLPALNLTTLPAGIWMVSPFLGLRPSRAARSDTENVPKPIKATV